MKKGSSSHVEHIEVARLADKAPTQVRIFDASPLTQQHHDIKTLPGGEGSKSGLWNYLVVSLDKMKYGCKLCWDRAGSFKMWQLGGAFCGNLSCAERHLIKHGIYNDGVALSKSKQQAQQAAAVTKGLT